MLSYCHGHKYALDVSLLASLYVQTVLCGKGLSRREYLVSLITFDHVITGLELCAALCSLLRDLRRSCLAQ